MNGLGFFAWQLNTIRDVYTPVQLATLLSQARVKWVSWKLANGIYPYNQIDGTDDLLIEYMQALEDVGIVSGGWSYNYPEKPGTQADLIASRIEQIATVIDNFDHWMLDIEREWKKTGLTSAIDSLLNFDTYLPVGFCSYRYPDLHPPLNFSRFLSNPTITFNAPQVYWLGAHNPEQQLDDSFDQYTKITSKPFVPIGAAWGQEVSGVYWEPTADDLRKFVVYCQGHNWNNYGFWSLDWIVKKQRLDMLEAIAGAIVQPPPPIEPPIEPPPAVPEYVRVRNNDTNIRSAPNLLEVSDVGNMTRGAVLRVDGMSGDFWQVRAYVAKSVVDLVTTAPPVEPPITPPASVPEYRAAHDREYGDIWREGVPEVFHFDQDAPTKLTEAWQKFIMALNPGMDGAGWRSLAKWDRAFTNGTGYGNPNGNLYADFINFKDMGSPLPVNDKCRICGGAIIRGVLNGNILTIETLDGSKPPPSLEWVLARPWLYFEAITVRADGSNGRFPQNAGKPVYWPLVATGKVTVKINTIMAEKPYPYLVRVG